MTVFTQQESDSTTQHACCLLRAVERVTQDGCVSVRWSVVHQIAYIEDWHACDHKVRQCLSFVTEHIAFNIITLKLTSVN